LLTAVTCVGSSVKALFVEGSGPHVLFKVERSEARTNDLDQPEGRCRLGMWPVGGGVGAPCVTWVLDECDVVGDNNRDLGVPG
jgi:hypothetical protein